MVDSTEPPQTRATGSGGLGRIGICLSGGGYRAAAFHLGALGLLSRADLLEDVIGLSTVSGGTFTGARWALALAKGQPFEGFYASFREFLLHTDCIHAALGHLGAARGTPSHRQSLITAAAEVYASPGFMGPAKLGTILQTPTQLTEISFNTTEFQTGLNFRFLKSQNRARIGNGNLWIDPSVALRIRLADIVAASSCFPGGFEPIQYPDDFVWDAAEGGMPGPPSLTQNAAGRLPAGLALMDGGIYDNTGLDALLLAERRDSRESTDGSRLFETVVVSDVDQRADLLPDSDNPAQRELQASFFHFEPEKRAWSVPLGVLLWLIRGLALTTGGLSVMALDLLWRHRLSEPWIGWLAAVGLALAVSPFLLEWWIRSRLHGRIAQDVEQLWDHLLSRPPATALELGELRAKSLFAMASTVFMKRVRALQLQDAFKDSRIHDRLVPNFIYRFLEIGRGPHGAPKVTPLPTPGQVDIARTAHAMPTNLWFDDDQQLETVIAAGQNTMCFTLLEHLIWRVGNQPTPHLAELQARLTGLWKQLQEDPRRFARAGSLPGPT